MKQLFRVLLSIVLVSAAFVFLPALSSEHQVSAATITVDGDCTYADLATAIDTAASGDTIAFDCDTSPATIAYGSEGELLIDKELTIDGEDAITLDAETNSRHFRVASTGNLTLANIELINGSASNIGGAIYIDGGSTTINSATISGSDTVSGGAIYNSNGTLSIANSTFSDNTAQFNGGAVFDSFGTLTVTNSTFANNSADFGGAIIKNSGPATVTNSTFTGNSAGDTGGAILNYGTVEVVNSTFSGNQAGSGGAIYNNTGIITVTTSTLAGNSASAGNTVFNLGGSATFIASVLVSDGANCGSSIISGGYNLTDDDSCGFDAEGDIQGNADLGSLADNGGPTLTMLPGPDGDAIDAIPITTCSQLFEAIDQLDEPSDQRGVSRHQGFGCDIGAVEIEADFIAVESTLCANRYNGDLRMPRTDSCASTEVTFQLPDDRPLDACINRYNGDLRYTRTGTCASTEMATTLLGDGNQSVCVNRYNGDIRVPRFEGQCASTETARDL